MRLLLLQDLLTGSLGAMLTSTSSPLSHHLNGRTIFYSTSVSRYIQCEGWEAVTSLCPYTTGRGRSTGHC